MGTTTVTDTTATTITTPDLSLAELVAASHGYRDALMLSRTPETAQGAELETRNKILARFRSAAAPQGAPVPEKVYHTAFKEVGVVIRGRNEAGKALDLLKAEVQALTAKVTELTAQKEQLTGQLAGVIRDANGIFTGIRNAVAGFTPPKAE